MDKNETQPAADAAAPVTSPTPTPNPTPESKAPVIDSALGIVHTLSDDEQMEFLACEAVIETGWSNFVQVGLALARIRDLRLYRGEFQGFDTYCRQKWQDGRNYVDRLISGAEVFSRLMTSCHHSKPQSEAQVRPLVSLTAEEAQQAWELAAEKAGGRKITARLVKNAIQGLKLGTAAAPVVRPPRLNKAEQRRLIDDAFGQLLVLLSQKASHDILTAKVEALHVVIQPLFAKKSGR